MYIKTIVKTLTLVSIFSTTFGFSAKNPWKNRPLVPEIAQNLEAKSTESPTKKEKWDPLRFVSQSSKFITLPSIIPKKRTPKVIKPGDVIWKKGNSICTWSPLDDVVMGGVSSSTFENGIWSGEVSDGNSGGFIGLRTTPLLQPLDMSQCQGVEFKIKGGKNKIFKAVIRDSTDFNGVCWTSTFGDGLRLSDELSAKIYFNKLIPTIFARTVPDQTLNSSNVVGFQLVFSKFLFDGELNPKFQLVSNVLCSQFSMNSVLFIMSDFVFHYLSPGKIRIRTFRVEGFLKIVIFIVSKLI